MGGGFEGVGYDSATNTWTTKAPMPAARVGVAAGVVNGILYAVGELDHVSSATQWSLRLCKHRVDFNALHLNAQGCRGLVPHPSGCISIRLLSVGTLPRVTRETFSCLSVAEPVAALETCYPAYPGNNFFQDILRYPVLLL